MSRRLPDARVSTQGPKRMINPRMPGFLQHLRLNTESCALSRPRERKQIYSLWNAHLTGGVAF
jgi:hypothetical protein